MVTTPASYDIVNLYFSGKGPYSFVLTEERVYSTISKKLVNYLGLPINRTDKEFQINDGSNQYSTNYIKIKGLELLGQYFPETSMILVELQTTTIFGVIGTDILDAFTIQRQNGQISLHAHEDDLKNYC